MAAHDAGALGDALGDSVRPGPAKILCGRMERMDCLMPLLEYGNFGFGGQRWTDTSTRMPDTMRPCRSKTCLTLVTSAIFSSAIHLMYMRTPSAYTGSAETDRTDNSTEHRRKHAKSGGRSGRGLSKTP